MPLTPLKINSSAAADEKPYAGLLVISLEQAVAAPLCSCRLAEGGARVIKIERQAGDFARNYDQAVKGDSSYFVWANHGKESIQLDIKKPEDTVLLHRMLAQADVFIQNLAPGAVARAGFDLDSLREQYPRLITCDISGYGTAGHYQNMKAYDFLVQCESGLVSVTGAPDSYGRIGVSVCDIGAGMNALIGVQQALFRRERTGKGGGVAVSLFDTAADWMTVPLMHAQYGSGAPERVGMHHPSIAPYGAYSTADNQTLVISIQNEREWATFCSEVLKQPTLLSDKRFASNTVRVENREVLDQKIDQVFSGQTRKVLSMQLQAAGIAFAAVNSVDELIQHPQLRRRKVTLSNGEEAELVASPQRYSYESDCITYGAVPTLGEHNKTLRTEFGITREECKTLNRNWRKQ